MHGEWTLTFEAGRNRSEEVAVGRRKIYQLLQFPASLCHQAVSRAVQAAWGFWPPALAANMP